MNILNTTRAHKYFTKHPLIEIYNGYEIRDAGHGMFLVDAAIAIYGLTVTHIEDCKEFIDRLIEHGVAQYDDEAVMKYLINKKK